MTEAQQKEKINSQGATEANLDSGQGTAGAPKEPQDKQAPKVEQAKTDAAQATTTTQATTAEATAQTQSETTTKATETKVANDWPQFQDEAIKATANILKDTGLSFEEAKLLFAKDGVVGSVDLPALEAKVGKDKAALAMIGVKDYQTRQQAFIDQTIKEVHTVVGGKESFEKIKIWATDKAKEDQAFNADLVKYKQMMDAGGVSARAAARDLLQAYTSSSDTSGVKTKMVNGDKSVGVSTTETPLSRSDYMKLLKEAHKKGDRAEINRLDARRRAGIKAKI